MQQATSGTPTSVNPMPEAALNSKYEAMLAQFRLYCGDVSGQRVLDLGSDSRGEMAAALRERLGVGTVIGVNPVLSAPVVGRGDGLHARQLKPPRK